IGTIWNARSVAPEYFTSSEPAPRSVKSGRGVQPGGARKTITAWKRQRFNPGQGGPGQVQHFGTG
ncbi:MAG: hypothetical protein ACKOD9_01380, partial [Rubrivivax sp.]